MRLFPIFSRHLMRQLEHYGFIVVKISKNFKFPDKDVYYFEETPEFRQIVNQLIQKRK